MINYKLKYPIIAVDWDSTLYFDDYEGGQVSPSGIYYLKKYKSLSGSLILYTCRAEQQELDDIIKWCKSLGLEFDAINKNIPEHEELWLKEHPNSTISPKPFWNLLIDDTAFGTYNHIDWDIIGKEISKMR